ncbi:hypothetical protein FRC10_000592 [Ceratobasidium sp. 414]|nr:hypothetical protein FRC10_000592 [Ceratobasidium sp. 414]
MPTYFIDNLNTAAGYETAGVSAGGLYIFDRELSKAQKADVLNSTLLAQIAADKNYDRTSDVDNWYASVHDFDFDKYSFSNSISAGQFVIDRLKNAISSSKSKNVESAVNSIKGMSDNERALQVFSSRSSSGKHANFQVGYCSSNDGNVVIDIDQDVKNPMSSTLKSRSTDAQSGKPTSEPSNTDEADILRTWLAFQTMTLNKYVYDRVRDAVLQKLGDYANDYVADVPM